MLQLIRHGGCISVALMNLEVQDDRIRHVVALMTQHRARPLAVSELARAVNMSPSYLRRLFRAHVGMSPFDYCRLLRLEHAHMLLQTSFMSVKEVMAASGWNDPSHFCREFKRRFGTSPGGLRRDRVTWRAGAA
jgi:transcriptional regulator GlxA family with amidase domain